MAKRPAKNITSLPSQTMVPTLVALGLLMVPPCAAGKVVADMATVYPTIQARRPLKTAEYLRIFGLRGINCLDRLLA
jgi:hypothetical protein